jgi:hypothetical protein
MEVRAIYKDRKKLVICVSLILLFLVMFLSFQFSLLVTKLTPKSDNCFSYAQGPEITNIIYTPDKPEWYDNVTITTQITDPWGIDEVWINYGADNDAYAGWGANFTMTHVADDLYTYTIKNSIWAPPFGPAFGSYLNFTIYAKNGLGQWSRSNFYRFYMNDTVSPVVQMSFEEGSGLQRMNLSLYMGNGTLLETFTSTNLNETFYWDVSSLPDYNISEPASYYTANLTVWDKSTPFNKDTIVLHNIRIDNTPPSISFINSYKNRTDPVQDNRTLTGNPISATNFMNNLTSTYDSDSIYHTFSNETAGFLQIAYGFNLSTWNITSEMIKTLSITLEGKISYSDSSIIAAGWKIWNWEHNNFTTIDSTIFNSTTNVADTIYLTSSNKSLFIKSTLNHRLEIFLFVNTTGPAIEASIDYIVYNLTYYQTDEWYNRDNSNITVDVIGLDLLSFDYMVLYHHNTTLYQWNNSGEYIQEINTTGISEGLVALNLTVYDKAGNSNTSSLFINADYFGPVISIISPEYNGTIGSSGIWNLIVPVELSGYDIAENFQRMELWIDGQIGPVTSGQLGQIFEYDAYGNITYEQKNATWFDEGDYTYYWNASQLIHGSKHELTLRAYDGFDNPSEFVINLTTTIFQTNVTLVDVGENYTANSDHIVTLEFSLINYGNSTLMDFTPQITIPSQWSWSFKDVDANDFKYLSPGQTLTFKIEIIPRSVQNRLNQSIDITINCKIIENLTQSTNNYLIQLSSYLIVNPKSGWDDIKSTVFLALSIIIGLGIGILSWYTYRYLRELAKTPPKTPEKSKKQK